MACLTRYSLFFATFITVTQQFKAFPGNTADFERLKKLAAIKVRILSKIGLSDRPAKRPEEYITKHSLGGHLKNTFNVVNKPRGEYFAEIQEVVSHSQIPENMTDLNVIQFKVVRDNQGRKLEVTSANLLVKIKYKRQLEGLEGRRQKLKLKKIILNLSNVDSEGNPTSLVSSVSTKLRRTKWLKIPLPSAVIENAMQRDDQNLFLHLQCKGCDKYAKLILINSHRKVGRSDKLLRKGRKGKAKMREIKLSRKKRRLNRTRPFLILHTKVRTYIRSKRNALICRNNSTCCMENLHVDFHSFGWGDWIIAPKSFETGVCEGACSNKVSTCKETKSTFLRIIYADQNNNIIFTSLPNMIVTECGCARDK